MSVSFATKCPDSKCGMSMLVDVNSVGRSVICPECGSPFRVESFHAVKPGTESPLPVAEPGDASGQMDDSEELSLKNFGRFELRKVLGKGGFGRVYLAWDPNLERMVALKVAFSRSDNGKHRERVLREAKAQLLLRHDAIVPALECDQVDGCLYIVFQYVDGETLSSRLRRAPVERHEAVNWIRDLADALAFAHANRVIHRDVKPHNILIDLTGRPYITDFGLVHWLDDGGDLTKPGSFIGTIPYMAPELLTGHEQTAGNETEFYRGVDQYSLGVVLYELLTGHRPFEGRISAVVAMKLAQEPPCPRQHDPSIPVDLAAICLKALHRDPDHRFRDCASFAMALTEWVTESQAIFRPVRESAESHHRPKDGLNVHQRRKTITLVVAALLLTLTVAGIVIAFPPEHNGPDLRPVRRSVSLHQQSPTLLDLQQEGLSPSEVRQSQERWARDLGIDEVLPNSIGMQFCLVPPGQYMMGTSETERKEVLDQSRVPDEWKDISQREPEHVIIPAPFFISRHEVSELQYEKIVGFNPSMNVDTSAVDSITYEQALDFCRMLSAVKAEKDAGRSYRLPTEMEWEFACRADFSSPDESSGRALHLEQMLGGVSEWCSDWFDSSARQRVVRGGSDLSPSWFRRPGYRRGEDPGRGHKSRGFRVILELRIVK